MNGLCNLNVIYQGKLLSYQHQHKNQHINLDLFPLFSPIFHPSHKFQIFVLFPTPYFHPLFRSVCSNLKVHFQIPIQKQKMDLSEDTSRDLQNPRGCDEPGSLRNKDKNSCVPSFISKTYEILEKDEHSDIIVWGELGKNFYVKNIKEFEEKILPVYFRHKNFASFVRQLNMYDFHKIRGEQKHIFEHKLFRKGCHYLLQDIKRKCFKKMREDECEDIVEDQIQVEEVKPKKPVLAPSNLPNLREEQVVKQKVLAEKEKEKQKAYQLMSEERSKNRKRNLELMNEIIGSLQKMSFQSEKEIKQQINVIKSNPKYQSLRGKYYIYEIFKKIRESLYVMRPRNTIEDLDELSIEEEILFNEIEKPNKAQITSLTNFETENFMKSGQHHTNRHIYGEEFYSKDMF